MKLSARKVPVRVDGRGLLVGLAVALPLAAFISAILPSGAGLPDVEGTWLNGALVMMGLLVLGWMRSRAGALSRSGTPRRLELRERLRVGPRRELLLVRVGGRTRMIGSSEQGLTDLGLVPEENPDPLGEEMEEARR
ncbi:MAG: flagellar biosynthetic protein FliO [Planctomycetota bacterium]